MPIEYMKETYQMQFKPLMRSILYFGNEILVGVRGFEPPTSWSQTMRATSCATPRTTRV